MDAITNIKLKFEDELVKVFELYFSLLDETVDSIINNGGDETDIDGLMNIVIDVAMKKIEGLDKLLN